MTSLAKMVTWMVFCFAAALSTAQAETQPIFQTLDGKTASLENYLGQGKWSVVVLWAHGCHVCNQEAEQYAQFHAEHNDKHARVVGISIDGLAERKQAQQFVMRHDLPFPNLTAETEAVMRWYQEQTGASFFGTPTILIYAPDGKLKAGQAGAVPTDVIEKFIAENS